MGEARWAFLASMTAAEADVVAPLLESSGIPVDLRPTGAALGVGLTMGGGAIETDVWVPQEHLDEARKLTAKQPPGAGV